MCCSRVRHESSGFSLVELLVVLAVIAVAAAILLPMPMSGSKGRAKAANARSEMQGLQVAIKVYHFDYGQYPCSPAAEKASAGRDFTFGTAGIDLSPGATPIENGLGYETNNSEVVTVLLDVDRGPNSNHVRNPRRIQYWNPRIGTTIGVSTADYVARDPWGSPYFITLDMNDDKRCMDAYYRRASVTERQPGDDTGYHGLSRIQPGDNFQANGSVMIWSAGPDRIYAPQQKANIGLNRDNVLISAN